MELLNFLKEGVIEDIYLDMDLVDFRKTELNNKVFDTIYLCEDTKDSEFIYLTDIGIEVIFTFNKITNISIDPNYENLNIGGLIIHRSLSLSKLIKCYYGNNILWKFNPREEFNQIEVITITGVSTIFTFDEDDFFISKFRLNSNYIWS